jgi:hypothetical protein
MVFLRRGDNTNPKKIDPPTQIEEKIRWIKKMKES